MNSPTAWTILFHILGVVFWVGGILILTQVLGVHTQEQSAEARGALVTIERKLMRGMVIPGALITLASGGLLLHLMPGSIHEHWLQAKLALVAILIGMSVVVHLRAGPFQSGKGEMTHRECMVLHGVIATVFLGILVLVMIKPF